MTTLKKTFIFALTYTGILTHFAPVHSWSHPTSLHLSPSIFSSKKSTFSRNFCANNFKASAYPASSPSVLTAAASEASISHSTDVPPIKFGPEITFGNTGIKMNWYGVIYGTIGLSLGFIWWSALLLCEFIYKVLPPWGKKNKGKGFDPNRRIPITISYIWGMIVMGITGCLPKFEGRENLKLLHDKESNKSRSAMFVANHTSFMDIYFVAAALGFRNYKMIAKKELLKIPILSRAMKTCDHILLDRENRKSQFEAYKKGVKGLKTPGLNVVTFAEGTRSKTGVLGQFKKGAFKMAQSAGAPIVPISIGYANEVHPPKYIFPMKPSRFGKHKACIYIEEPIETVGKSDDELFEEVRKKMIQRLPESQRPVE